MNSLGRLVSCMVGVVLLGLGCYFGFSAGDALLGFLLALVGGALCFVQ